MSEYFSNSNNVACVFFARFSVYFAHGVARELEIEVDRLHSDFEKETEFVLKTNQQICIMLLRVQVKLGIKGKSQHTYVGITL